MDNKITYTKVIITAVMVTYFVGFFVGLYAVFIDINQLSTWLLYVGTPATSAIGFYCWKSKSENVVKIRKGLNKEAVRLQQQLARLPPEQLQAYNDIKMDVDAILAEMDM